MKPGLDRILAGAADAIDAELLPHLQGAAAGHASTVRQLVLAAAQAADREPDILMAEIAAMRRLFEDAADTLLPGDLCEQLHAAADASQPTNYSVSALTDLCNELKAVLIVLQMELEDISAPWAKLLEAQAWDILRMGVDRRQFDLHG
jgi:hypothetical protein